MAADGSRSSETEGDLFFCPMWEFVEKIREKIRDPWPSQGFVAERKSSDTGGVGEDTRICLSIPASDLYEAENGCGARGKWRS